MHQKVIDDKVSKFVGRDDLRKQVVKHCFPEKGNESVLTIHGAPGCGKSGLLAATTRDYDHKSNKDHLTFKQVVDSCPGSARLENILRRLHHNLRKFRRKRGESDICLEPPATFADLKNQTGKKYPETIFLGFYDGMNQLLP